mmetsp:Transcript_16744/g.38885  ORF Transcript_16744/g.38885 Transcript_16744/m.38885 type:complete len:267 (+) Transcript_16744:126-926(+)
MPGPTLSDITRSTICRYPHSLVSAWVVVGTVAFRLHLIHDLLSQDRINKNRSFVLHDRRSHLGGRSRRHCPPIRVEDTLLHQLGHPVRDPFVGKVLLVDCVEEKAAELVPADGLGRVVLVTLLRRVPEHDAAEVGEDVVKLTAAVGVVLGVRYRVAQAEYCNLLAGNVQVLHASVVDFVPSRPAPLSVGAGIPGGRAADQRGILPQLRRHVVHAVDVDGLRRHARPERLRKQLRRLLGAARGGAEEDPNLLSVQGRRRWVVGVVDG